MPDNYNIPLGIDPKGVLTTLDQMEAGLMDITKQARASGESITEALTQSAKSGDALTAKMTAGAGAIKKLQDAAKSTGITLNEVFTKPGTGVSGLDAKVTSFAAKLKDVIGKPVSFKFDLDAKGFDALAAKLNSAKSEMEGFELIVDSAKERLQTLGVGTDGFNKLFKQIEDAEKFLNVLKEDIAETNAAIAAPAPEGGAIPQLAHETAAAEEPVVSLRSRLRQMREELAAMELAGQGGSAAFNQLSIEAGDLADQAGDTSQRIRALASDTKGLDAGISAVRGLAGAFAVGQGALAAFGEQSEEAAKAIQKVQGAMAILQGIQEVANVLNKDSALSIYLSTYARGANTTAIAAETVAIEGEAVATEAATVATNTFTAALLANPITAIVAVFAIAAVALYKYATATASADAVVKRLNDDLSFQNKILSDKIGIITRGQNIDLANADFLGKSESEKTKITIQGLQDRLFAEQDNLLTVREAYLEGLKNKKITNEQFKKLSDELNAAEDAALNTKNEIETKGIVLQKQKRDEDVKLNLEFLRQKQAQADQEKAIKKEVQSYINQIAQLKI